MRLIRPKPTRGGEVALRRVLGRMVRDVRASLGQVTSAGTAKALGVALRKRWPDARLEAAIRSAGVSVEAAASRPWRPLEKALARRDGKRDAAPYDGVALLERWTREAFGLVKSVRDEVAEGLRKDVLKAIEKGQDPRELAAKWRRQGIPVEFGTLEGRTKVIAQHQMANLNALVQKERAKATGLELFVWRHSGATRFRPHHKARDGITFEYDTAPELPGTVPNCGCWAEPVIPDDLVEGLGLKAAYGVE